MKKPPSPAGGFFNFAGELPDAHVDIGQREKVMYTAIASIIRFERRCVVQGLRQYFNLKGSEFQSDEDEPAIRKYLRTVNAL